MFSLHSNPSFKRNINMCKLSTFENPNRLQKKVYSIIQSYCKKLNKAEAKKWFNDLSCENGSISELIYYSDTLRFYKYYKNEINELLSEKVKETGYYIDNIFADFATEDQLCLETHNQNLLAWFAFEEVASQIYIINFER